MLQNFRPPYNATVYTRLRTQGALFAGKTNLDQFGMGSGTVDSCFGATRNPWQYTADAWHIAGGSSGGSAAAVAAGLCYAALGSDTGGSTRNPASYCGVVGLKPTYGLLSRHGLIALVNSMDVPGILTRTVDDCAIMLAAMSGADPLDSTTLPAAPERLAATGVTAADVSRLRVGIPEEYHCAGLDAEVLQTWRKVADLLEQAGARVERVSLPNTAASIFVYTILNQCEVASNMSRYDGIEFGHRAEDAASTEQLYARTREEGFNAVVKSRILAGNYYLLRRNYTKYFEQALRVRRLISEDFRRVFSGDGAAGVDVLLTPTTLTAAPTHEAFGRHSNRDQCAEQDFFTQPANMAGVPAVSVPVRLSAGGLPLSVQLMGDRCTDGRLLAVAKWIEERVEFPHRPVVVMEEGKEVEETPVDAT